jgi:hypothetical protein
MAADLAVIRSSAAGSQAEGRKAGKLETRALGTLSRLNCFVKRWRSMSHVQYSTVPVDH